MPFRHLVDGGVVTHTLRHEIQHRVFDAIGQGFFIASNAANIAECIFHDEIIDAFPVYALAVDMQNTGDHLDLIAGQADDPFDVIGLVVPWQFENSNITTLRIARPYASFEKIGRKWKGIFRIAVAEFGNE